MFIEDCLRKKLKVVAVPYFILSLREERPSTWFSGCNDKFFFDLGASYFAHYGKFALLIARIQLFKHKRTWLNNYSYQNALKQIKKGLLEFKKF